MIRIPPSLRDVFPPAAVGTASNLGAAGLERDPRNDRQLRRWAPVRFVPFDYQEDIIAGLRNLAGTDQRLGMLMMPTGSGKTSTVAAALLRDMKSTDSADALIVWIAPQLELLAQAASAIERVWASGEGPDSLDILFLKSSTAPPNTGRPAVILATPLSAASFLQRNNLLHRAEYLVFDEAHHLGAERFGSAWRDLVSRATRNRLALGLSATPTRTVQASFSELEASLGNRIIYPKRLLPDPVATLTSRGVLSTVSFQAVQGIPAHCRAASRAMDAQKMLTSDPDYWLACVECAQAFGKPLIVYCPDRLSGSLFACHLRHIGVNAEYIDGDDAYSIRIAALERFRDGRTSVLVNVHLLLEGVDAPSASGALLTYRIQSEIRLSQVVGRVMRGSALGGTDAATVACADIDLVRQLSRGAHTRDFGAYWSRGVAV